MQSKEQKERLERDVVDFQRINYGPRYTGKSLSELQMSDHIAERLRTWMKKPEHMLVFCSGPGYGKTHFCSALTEWMLMNFDTYRYYKEENLLKSLRSVIHDGAGDWAEALRYKIDDELVILDDVGSWFNMERVHEKDNNWKIEVFFAFLDERYNSMKPTIITSNLDKKGFLKAYSERVVSRLFATENTIIEIPSDEHIDMRGRGL